MSTPMQPTQPVRPATQPAAAVAAGPAAVAPVPDISGRRPPALGGFSLVALGLEIRRMTRNRRTMIFSIVLPVVLFGLIGTKSAYATQADGRGNLSAFIMLSVALYGAVLATTSGGAMVSIERAAGWSRQLRLTPLSATAYIAIKMLTALTLGAASVIAVYAVGIISHKPSMPISLWIISGLCVWIGSLVFAAFGLFMGYLLPTENVMQFLGIGVFVLSLFGGLFYPLSTFPHVLQVIAKFTPLYGLNEIVHAPLLNQGVHLIWIVNAVAWLVIFGAGAAWRLRRDTARV
jgi:ABC-2 type transport system permease protein